MFVDTNKYSLETLLVSSFLGEKDIAEISRFKLEESKKEKAVSFILKNKYVGKYHLNEFDKPISEECEFNISHSHGVVVFVQSSVPIGVDIEKLRPMKDDMTNFISSNEEKEYIQSYQSFFEVWTNKESLTKCLGTGIKDKISSIPGLPINGVKEYKNKQFYCRTIKYNDYVISVTQETNKPFEILIREENL